MMKKQILTGAAVLLCLLGGAQPAFAQRGEKASPMIRVISTKEIAANMKVSSESAVNGILVAPRNTPRVELSDENQESVSKNERKNMIPWVEISVPFGTLAVTEEKSAKRKGDTYNPAAQPGSWLENVDVQVEMVVPVLNHNGKKEYGIVTGNAVLAPIQNFRAAGKEKAPYITHLVKFYVSPYIVSRYVASTGVSSEKLKKLLSVCPVRVEFRYGSQRFGGIKTQDKDFADQVKALGFPAVAARQLFETYDKDSRSLYGIAGGIIPASKTPWAWIGYDQQEHTLDEAARR